MYKKGDKFKIIEGSDGKIWAMKGEVITLLSDVMYGDKFGSFLYPSGETWVYHFSDLQHLPFTTEAETRNAKFGTLGVIKSTGERWAFNKEVGGMWRGMTAGGVILSAEPSYFRLDHEPEYKEIPFSEATHEQRMDVSALRFDGTPVEQIFQFDNGEYMFTISACKAVANAWNILKVRIPT